MTSTLINLLITSTHLHTSPPSIHHQPPSPLSFEPTNNITNPGPDPWTQPTNHTNNQPQPRPLEHSLPTTPTTPPPQATPTLRSSNPKPSNPTTSSLRTTNPQPLNHQFGCRLAVFSMGVMGLLDGWQFPWIWWWWCWGEWWWCWEVNDYGGFDSTSPSPDLLLIKP